MKFYRINTGDRVKYAATLDDTKIIVKAVDSVYRSAVTVEEVELSTDKNSLLDLLNGSGTHKSGPGIFSSPTRTWVVTVRGGLLEAGGIVRGD